MLLLIQYNTSDWPPDLNCPCCEKKAETDNLQRSLQPKLSSDYMANHFPFLCNQLTNIQIQEDDIFLEDLSLGILLLQLFI